MPLALVVWVLASFAPTALAASGDNVSKALNAPLETVTQEISKRGFCSDLSSSALCRNFPWELTHDEGVIVTEPLMTVVIQDRPHQDAKVSKLIYGVLPEWRLEMLSLFLFVAPETLSALEKSSASSVLILILAPEAPHGLKSAFFAARGALLQNLAPSPNAWWRGLENNLAWEPPKDFQRFYKFQTF